MYACTHALNYARNHKSPNAYIRNNAIITSCDNDLTGEFLFLLFLKRWIHPMKNPFQIVEITHISNSQGIYNTKGVS